MNSFKRKAFIAAMLAGLAVMSGCAATEKQLKALDGGAFCHKGGGFGVTSTTAFVGGAAKVAGTAIDGGTCSIRTVNPQPHQGPVTNAPSASKKDAPL